MVLRRVRRRLALRAETRGGSEGTLTTWKYTYAIRPRLLRPVAEPLGQRLLDREIRARIEAFRRACSDPVVLADVC